MNQKSRVALDKRRIQVRNTTVVIFCAALLVVSFLVSMSTGYLRLSPADTLRTLLGGGTERETLILFGFRLPRIVISMLAGSGLALSGRMIQGVSQNALADPGLLGINSGAGIMVVLYVLFFGGTTALSLFALPFLAFLGAGLTAALIYLLSWRKGEGASPMRLLLTGVAMQAGLLALTTLLVVKLDETQYSFFASWQAGSIWGSNWKYVSALLPWLLILIPYVLSRARVLDVLSLGDDAAVGLGVNVQRERKCLLAAAVALAAACVAVSGNISFVGLIAPHLAHRLVGPRHRVLLPVCALVGALLVSAADTIARIILQPSGLPTGIVVAVIGAPYFLYLLIKSKE